MTSTDDEYKFSIQYFNCQANKKKKLETSYTHILKLVSALTVSHAQPEHFEKWFLKQL